jgi:hypothetical protein
MLPGRWPPDDRRPVDRLAALHTAFDIVRRGGTVSIVVCRRMTDLF